MIDCAIPSVTSLAQSWVFSYSGNFSSAYYRFLLWFCHTNWWEWLPIPTLIYDTTKPPATCPQTPRIFFAFLRTSFAELEYTNIVLVGPLRLCIVPFRINYNRSIKIPFPLLSRPRGDNDHFMHFVGPPYKVRRYFPRNAFPICPSHPSFYASVNSQLNLFNISHSPNLSDNSVPGSPECSHGGSAVTNYRTSGSSTLVATWPASDVPFIPGHYHHAATSYNPTNRSIPSPLGLLGDGGPPDDYSPVREQPVLSALSPCLTMLCFRQVPLVLTIVNSRTQTAVNMAPLGVMTPVPHNDSTFLTPKSAKHTTVSTVTV